MSEARRRVLDASALLAYLQDEPGAEEVEQALGRGAVMGAANWAEVLSKLAEAGQKPELVVSRLEREGLLGTALEIVPLDERQAVTIAQLRMTTRSAGLSLGDRACLALGKLLGLVVLTTDRHWMTLKLRGVKIQLAR